jgi:flagellar hook assembly protein FlgD
VAPGTLRIMRIVSAHPNPFNPRLTVTFTVDRPQRVTVAVYDPAGRRVAILEEGILPAGTHAAVWDGRDATGRGAASGPYLLQLRGDTVRQTRKVLLLR